MACSTIRLIRLRGERRLHNMERKSLRNRLLNVLGHVFFWGILFIIFCPEPLGLGAFSLTIFEQEETLWFFLYGFAINLILFYSFVGIGLPRVMLKKWFPWLILINLSWWAIVVLLESLIDVQYATWALVDGQEGGRSFSEWVSTNLVVSGLILLAANFYGFTSAWFRDRQNQRDLEQEKLRAELTALKHQVNPHFLFNVLNSLYGLAFRNDDEPTAEGIARLSQLMRYMLYESNDREVPLEREIDYLKNYISLQQLRLDEKTDVIFEVDGSVVGKSIAPMLLIPFVENAFKYGISTAKSSFVHIFLETKEAFLRFEVKNSVHVIHSPPKEEYGGIGLKNVRKRLELLYPDQYLLRARPEGKMFWVELTLTK